MSVVTTTELRARFAARLSELYGQEVPAYRILVDVAEEVNRRFIDTHADAERLGSLSRVTAERHGAIRVGSPLELRQAATVFAAFGMHPVGYYDLRDAAPRPIPVVSTAFRPVDSAELAANPFRVFTSMLVPEDRRFFEADLERRLREAIGKRTLFPEELLALAAEAAAGEGLEESKAERLLELAAEAFALSPDPIDEKWYQELDRISAVAADIGGVASTHINHLTPRVLDIDDLYASMEARGIEMIDDIQGPPDWEGPDVLLRQTSFRALAEPRVFRRADGTIGEGELRVRFGEVEARGIALTELGRDLYDGLLAEVDRRTAEDPGLTRREIARAVWREGMPRTEQELEARGLAYFTYAVAPDAPRGSAPLPQDLDTLLGEGWVVAQPIVYEDFLPRSAAGIFASNLTAAGVVNQASSGVHHDLEWLSEAIGIRIRRPEEVYEAQRDASLREVAAHLGIPRVTGGARGTDRHDR